MIELFHSDGYSILGLPGTYILTKDNLTLAEATDYNELLGMLDLYKEDK